MHKLIIFDLDNTLTKSKLPIDDEMSEIFNKLIGIKKVAIISGGSFKQIDKELLFSLKFDSNLKNLHIFPTDGTAYYNWDDGNGKWQKIYQESLSEKEKNRIHNALSEVLKEINFDTSSVIGNLTEDKDSAITFSGLGQDADFRDKEIWDPEQKIRLEIKKHLEQKLNDFEIRIAGTTSIDITSKGMDKSYGISKMVEYIKIPIDEMLFIGDSLFNGGNDNPVIGTGVKTISVKNPEETKKIIKDIINSNN